jgi:hypothetical protein
MEEKVHSIKMPFFEVIGNLSHHHFGWYHKISCHSLFWSLERVFEQYYRIISVWDPYCIGDNHLNSIFLANDIESFIIRLRILLNEVAFIIRQLYPNQVRGMPSPKGERRAENKEISINDLRKFTLKNPDFDPKLTELLKQNKDWLDTLRKQRDDIVHYKSQVQIFEPDKPEMTFAIMNPGGDYPTERTQDGEIRIVLTPVFEFVNSQMVSLLIFLNQDVVEFIMSMVVSKGFKYGETGVPGSTRLSCTGVALFNLINERGNAYPRNRAPQ